MEYINILSLDRSRSTITNTYLAEIHGGYALGEVGRTIHPVGSEQNALRESTCSCGADLEHCEFWGSILKAKDISTAYINKVKELNSIVFDASKTIKHSRFLRSSFSEEELVAVVLMRDFSSWSKSVKNAMKRNGEGAFSSIGSNKNFLLSDIRLFLRNFLITRYLEFMLNNIRLIHEAKKYKYCYIITSSEELINLEFTGVDTCTHILRGNRVRLNSENYQKWTSGKSINVRFLKFLSGFL